MKRKFLFARVFSQSADYESSLKQIVDFFNESSLILKLV